MTIKAEEILAISAEMRELRSRENALAERLCSLIEGEPVLKEALVAGLVKLNFKAPEGFYALIRDLRRDKRFSKV